MASLFAISAILGVTLAQTSTLTLPFYGYDQQSIVGSVVAVSNQITTLQLACPDNTDGSDCGLFPSQTLIVGPSTYNMFMSAPDGAFTGTQQCSATVCTESNGGSEANFPGSSVTTYDASDVASLPVTVTAGADKLGSGGATTTGGGSESATSTASTGSNASQTTASVTEMSGTAGTATESAASTSSSSAASLRDGGSLAAAFGLLLGSLLL